MNLYNNKLTRRTNLWMRKHFVVPQLRAKLNNNDATILCNNCIGGFVYHDFGLRFNSPTINMFFHGLDFFDFIEHLDYYLQQPLFQIPNPQYDLAAPDYPVAILRGGADLKDIELHFLHYKSFAEAEEKWEARKKRINPGNLFLIWSFVGMEKDEWLYKRAQQLPVKNKVLFVNHPVDHTKYPGFFYIKGFEKQVGLGQLGEFMDLRGHRYYDQFDFPGWLNNTKKNGLEKSMPKISVLMPAYNAEKYITEAIDSVLCQTYTDFEFIIIDDGSTDSTPYIIASYADPRIRYVKNDKNLGIVGALNRGIALAQGEYIARIDADDISLPERFALQVAYMDNNPEVGVCGTAIRLFGEGIEESDRFFSSTADALKSELLFNSCIAHPTAIIRRRILLDHDLRYEEAYKGREDYALWWEISKHSGLHVINQVLHRYRIHASQITAKKSDQMAKVALFLQQRMRDLGVMLDSVEETAFVYYCAGKSNALSQELGVAFAHALGKVIRANHDNHFFNDRALRIVCDQASIDVLCHLPPSIRKDCYRAAFHAGSLSWKTFVKLTFRSMLRKLRRVDHEREIGIITCHDVYNFGATLQAYALSKYISEYYKTCRIINYVPDYLYHLVDFMKVDALKWKTSFLRRCIYRLYVLPYNLSLLPKYWVFKDYLRSHIRLTKKYTSYSALAKEMPFFDAYICGSDQIWNSIAFPCGEDPAYYLAFAGNHSKKLSYAASFGAKEISGIGRGLIDRYLPGFTALSVREKSGEEILRSHGLDSITILDPVFLLPSEEWRTQKAKLVLPEKYILVYGYDNSSDMETATRAFSEKLACNVIHLHPDYRSAGPKEFLTLIDNAQLVITSSFHAVAFSVILHTQFIAVKTKNEALFERILNILEICGLQDRIYGSHYGTIDFNSVDRRMQPEIEKAKKFLRVLGDDND